MSRMQKPSSKKKEKREISYEQRAKKIGVKQALLEEGDMFSNDSVKEVK